jgi:general secretion pathway protein G
MTSAKSRTTNRRRVRGGFTLMEVLIVLAILAVIIGLVVPNLMKGKARADNDAAKVQVKAVEDALEMYALDHDGDYPPTISALMTSPGADSKWKGPYFKGNKAPADPWGNQIQYTHPGTHKQDGSPDVWSMGKDKQSNTADDLHNWGT